MLNPHNKYLPKIEYEIYDPRRPVASKFFYQFFLSGRISLTWRFILTEILVNGWVHNVLFGSSDQGNTRVTHKPV